MFMKRKFTVSEFLLALIASFMLVSTASAGSYGAKMADIVDTAVPN